MRRFQRALFAAFFVVGFCAPLAAQSSRPVYLYVASRATTGIQQGLLNAYRVDVTTGALSPVAGSPFLAGTGPAFVVVDPSGRFVYVDNNGSNNISAYQVDAVTGSLTPLPGSPFLTGQSPGKVRIDPTGSYLYAGSLSGVTAYSIDSVTGVLTPIVGSPFANGNYASPISFDPGGNHVYFGQSNAALLVDALNLQNGTFQNVQTIVADSNAYAMSFSPNGKFAFTVAPDPDLVRAYTVDAATGFLTKITGSPYATGPLPISTAVDGTGKFLYVANQNYIWQPTDPPSVWSGTISGFTIDPVSGTLGQMATSPFPSGINSNFIAVSPVGQFAYVHAYFVDTIRVSSTVPGILGYSIDPATGALIPLAGSPWMLGTFGSGYNIAISLGPTGSSNPFPAISSISPLSVVAGSTGFSLQVTGSNFVQGSTVYFSGQARSTTFVSSTQLTAAILASDIATGGTGVVSVFNPLPGGGFSASVGFSVANPPPTISSLSPASIVAGGLAGTLTISGTNFVSTSFGNFNGEQRLTTVVNSTQLRIPYLAADIANQGSASITVTNPSSGISGAGGTSSPVTFTILPASVQPTIGQLSPASVTAGAPGFTLNILGNGFTATSHVSFNLANVSTTYVSATQLQAAIPASAVAHAGFPIVGVSNPGLGVSQVATFTINSPPPGAGPVTPPSLPAGNASLTLNVAGTNFTPDSVVLVNGSVRVTVFVSTVLLQATLLPSDLSHGGTLNITISNPSPNGTGGGTTGAITFNVADYTVTPPATMPSVTAGQPVNVVLTIAPSGSFTNPVVFTATGLPMGASASFSPGASITPGSAQTVVTLSISTTARFSGVPTRRLPRWLQMSPETVLSLALTIVFSLGLLYLQITRYPAGRLEFYKYRASPLSVGTILMFLAMAVYVGQLGCGSGSSSGNVTTSLSSTSPANIAGDWTFSIASSKFGGQGIASGTITENSSNVSGSLNISGTPCAQSGSFTGSLNANSITASLNENGQIVALTGTVSADGSSVTGTYSAPTGGCTNGDTGTWSGTRSTPTNIAGNWNISTVSTKFLNQTAISGAIVQSGSNISGSLNISGSPCASVGGVTGTVNARSITASLNENGQLVILAGIVSADGNSASGIYTAPAGGCTNGDAGTWSGTRGGLISNPNGTPAGTYPIVVTATSGTVVHTATVNLTVM